MTLMWFRCHIPHLMPTHFGDTLTVHKIIAKYIYRLRNVRTGYVLYRALVYHAPIDLVRAIL